MLTTLKKIALASALVFSSLAANAAEDVIRFATEAAYPPFNERAADGSIVGWEIDLGMAMCQKMGRKCEFVAQDWDGMIPGLLSKRLEYLSTCGIPGDDNLLPSKTLLNICFCVFMHHASRRLPVFIRGGAIISAWIEPSAFVE